MSGQRWTWLAGVASIVALAVGWSSAATREMKRPVDWVALNPAFQGATFVNDTSTCAVCHEDVMEAFEHTRHFSALTAAGGTAGPTCENCHGPRSAHVDDPTGDLALTAPRAQSAVCLQCHEGGSRFGFKSGPHHSSEVTCTSCHSVMEAKSPRALLAKATETETCASCHTEVRTDLGKMSHHPVREGRIGCASCHNAHGSTPALLAKATLNDTCFTCHAEKRGPFVWEHAPARESCATCHVPHGSNQRNLLTAKDPFLCLSCHSYGGHINLPRYNRVSNPYGNGCSNCHVSMHGSNHPSGAKLTR